MLKRTSNLKMDGQIADENIDGRISKIIFHLTSGLSPPVKHFYWPFQGGTFLWIICVIYVLCFSCFPVCSLLPCVHLLGKGWPLGSCLSCKIVFLSLSNVLSWVRCDTWLYRLLIFAAFLTSTGDNNTDLFKEDLHQSFWESWDMDKVSVM